MGCVQCTVYIAPKVQLHVSALDISHLQVVHESLENSYTSFNMGCVQCTVYIAPKVQLHVSALCISHLQVVMNPWKVVTQALIWAVYSVRCT